MKDERSPATAASTASVLLLCGLPASGKSTFARAITDLHEQRSCTTNRDHDGNKIACKDSENILTPIVSRFDKILRIDYDSITQQELILCNDKKYSSQNDGLGEDNTSFGPNDLEAWRKSRVRALESLKDALTAHLTGNSNASSLLIIMDDNFHLRSMRRDVYRSCQEILELSLPSSQTQICFSTVYFSTPLEVCLQRNKLRTGKELIPIDVINRMASVMEPPDETKAYASFERFHVLIDNSNNTFDAGMNNSKNSAMLHGVDQCLQKSLQSPILPKNKLSMEEIAQLEQQRIRQREETLRCQIQRIDQLLRKMVGAVGRVEKKRSREANEVRKSIMESIRKRDDAVDRSDDSVVRHFACSILGTEINNDWYDLEDPLVQSMKIMFEEFQKDRKA